MRTDTPALVSRWMLLTALASLAGSVEPAKATPTTTRVGFKTRIVSSPTTPVKPHILFILTDDQRWDQMGCYGNTSIRTPNLDRLASQGARFDNLYTASPVCSSSRAAILSGLTAHQTGIWDNGGPGPDPGLPEGMPTVATHLNGAGYRTCFVGKRHPSGNTPREWGFQEVPSLLPPHPKDPSLTRQFTDTLIDFYERHCAEREGQPSFVWFAPISPHTPWDDYPGHPYSLSEILPPPGWPPTQRLSDVRWDLYYSTMSHLDEQIGRLLDTLDRLGLTQNTFVFLMSDNGYMMESHGYMGKGLPHEESSRVCALARGPGVKPGSVVTAPIVSTDFFETARDLAGLPELEGFECTSFLPVLAGKVPTRDRIYSEADGPEGRFQMIVKESSGHRFKYAIYLDKTPVQETLFDLMSDPFEQTDLAGLPQYADVMTWLRAEHAKWLLETPPLE